LTTDGKPAAPFAYEGSARTPQAIAEDVPPHQRDQLAQAHLDLHDQHWANALQHDPNVRLISWETDGTSIPFDTRPDSAATTTRPPHDVRVRALRIGRPWTESDKKQLNYPSTQPTYPSDASILILPYDLPRPEKQRRDAQLRAVLLTPVTLVGDAVVIPILYIAAYGFGQGP
ncbi:MAG TPA: hypothetical protein VF669_19815, partial [Tepidisphaeraceae bacterium]